MKKKISLREEEVPYLLERKSVRNLNARIRRDGTLFVSAPRTLPQGEIDAFLQKHADYLLRGMANARARYEDPPSPPALVEGATVPYLGLALTLRLREGEKNALSQEEGELIMTLCPGAGEGTRRRLLSAFLEARARTLLSEMTEEVYRRSFFSEFAYPTLRFRRMSGSFGSCRKAAGVVTLNLRLIHLPPRLIEYVILHELTHMLHPDHSPRFWSALVARMPDGKRRRAALREVPLDRLLWL